jgi:hypothetical protein
MSVQARLRQFALNVSGAVNLFFRAPPAAGRRPAWPPHGRLVIGALAAILVVVVVTVALDARSVAGARMLPAAVFWPFRYITDLGLSGWFLFPTAFLLLAIAAADSAALPRFSRNVLAAISIRIGFIFMAIAVPGLFVAILKRGGCLDVSAFGLASRLRELSLRACHHGVRRSHCHWCAMATAAPCDVDLCRDYRGQPGGRRSALPKRRHCRRHRRRHRRVAGSQLVRLAEARLCGSR